MKICKVVVYKYFQFDFLEERPNSCKTSRSIVSQSGEVDFSILKSEDVTAVAFIRIENRKSGGMVVIPHSIYTSDSAKILTQEKKIRFSAGDKGQLSGEWSAAGTNAI